MKPVHLSILIVVLIQYSGARSPKRPQNQRAVMSALQNILSPGNTERAKQLMQFGKRPVIEELPITGMRKMPELSPSRNRFQPCQQNILEVAPNLAPNMPCQRAPGVIHVPVPFPVPVKEPCPSSPLMSPFLPSASPVSAWTLPTNGLLPPVIPSQTRNHFLRKIPIPPPTL